MKQKVEVVTKKLEFPPKSLEINIGKSQK